MLSLFIHPLRHMAAAVALSGATLALAGAPVYKIEVLRNHDGLHPQTAGAISKRGEIAGSADVAGSWQSVGYRYRNGKLAELPNSSGALIRGINKAGDVVGMIYPNAFVWHADGTRDELGDLWVEDINASGQIAGSSDDLGETEAVIYDHGSITRLGKLAGGARSSARALNDAGQAAGDATLDGYARTHAFIWKDGVMTDLGTLGGDYSGAAAINANGHVAGVSTDVDGEYVAFIYDGATMHAVPPTKEGYPFSLVNGMNIHDELVGDYGHGPMLRARNGKTYLLAGLLDASGAAWDNLLTGDAINDAGQIVGIGTLNGYLRAYLATPVTPAR